jgi:hypothetical protein
MCVRARACVCVRACVCARVCVCACVCARALLAALQLCSGLVLSLYDTHAAVLGMQLIVSLIVGLTTQGATDTNDADTLGRN